MLLKELLGVKKYADQYQSKIMGDIATSKKIKLLGAGSHGVALLIGGNVFKIWERDRAYNAYVKFCMSHEDNPYLPKFSGGIKSMPAFWLRSREADDRVNYVKMEYLDACKSSDISDSANRVLHIFHNSTKKTDEAELRSSLSSSLDKEKELIDTLFEIKKLGFKFDLTEHLGNLMLRDKQLVLLDPIWAPVDQKFNVALSDWVFKQQNSKSPEIGKIGSSAKKLKPAEIEDRRTQHVSTIEKPSLRKASRKTYSPDIEKGIKRLKAEQDDYQKEYGKGTFYDLIKKIAQELDIKWTDLRDAYFDSDRNDDADDYFGDR